MSTSEVEDIIYIFLLYIFIKYIWDFLFLIYFLLGKQHSLLYTREVQYKVLFTVKRNTKSIFLKIGEI